MYRPRGEESMLSGLRIVAVDGVQSLGPVPKARCPGFMGGITPVGNADAFPSTPFGWFFPRPVSFLAR